MENSCINCQSQFNIQERKPRILDCFHTICSFCLENTRQFGVPIKCASDQKQTFKHDLQYDIPSILRIIEKQDFSRQIFICEKHKQPLEVLSEDNKFLCFKCIQQYPPKNNFIQLKKIEQESEAKKVQSILRNQQFDLQTIIDEIEEQYEEAITQSQNYLQKITTQTEELITILNENLQTKIAQFHRSFSKLTLIQQIIQVLKQKRAQIESIQITQQTPFLLQQIQSITNFINQDKPFKFDLVHESENTFLKQEIKNLFKFEINEFYQHNNEVITIGSDSNFICKWNIKDKTQSEEIQLNTAYINAQNTYVEQLFDNSLVVTGGRESDKESDQISLVDPLYSTYEYTALYSRMCNRSQAINHQIFIISGRSHNQTITQKCEYFDLQQKECQEINQIPIGVSHFGCTTDNKQIIVVGGETLINDDVTDQIQTYDPILNQWKVLTDVVLPMQDVANCIYLTEQQSIFLYHNF